MTQQYDQLYNIILNQGIWYSGLTQIKVCLLIFFTSKYSPNHSTCLSSAGSCSEKTLTFILFCLQNKIKIIIMCISTVYYWCSPCLVQAPSKFTMLRWGPRWLIIFSSDIRACVSLLLAVAVWRGDKAERETCIKARQCEVGMRTGELNRLRAGHTASLPNCSMTLWLKTANPAGSHTKAQQAAAVAPLRLQEYGTGVTTSDSYAGDSTLLSALFTQMHTWLSEVGFFFFVMLCCLTFQHFHCHFCAGLWMSETVCSCLDHPAKGSRSKSATWNTKTDLVGDSLNRAPIRPWIRFLFLKVIK